MYSERLQIRHVGACAVHAIGTIVTADRGFDGAPGLTRVDPLDGDALAALTG